MNFIDTKHQQRFIEMKKQTDRENPDCYYDSSLYILASLCKSFNRDAINDEYIDFDYIFEYSGVWSTSEQAMVSLAASLYNPRHKIAFSDIFENLSGKCLEVALQAIQIRYGVVK